MVLQKNNLPKYCKNLYWQKVKGLQDSDLDVYLAQLINLHEEFWHLKKRDFTDWTTDQKQQLINNLRNWLGIKPLRGKLLYGVMIDG